MPPHVLLAQFRTLIQRTPDFAAYSSTSTEHHLWLAKGHALLSRWRPAEAASFKLASDFLGGHPLLRGSHVSEVLGAVHRAVADLELQVPEEPQGAFGPGAMYDFFKALNQVVDSAKTSVLIIDPYMDDTIFDTYFSAVRPPVSIRILVRDFAAKVRPAIALFTSQYHVPAEARFSKDLHDRVLFIDGNECWVLGHSIKDAARSKPTYLAPLPPDVAQLKLVEYERIWGAATAI